MQSETHEKAGLNFVLYYMTAFVTYSNNIDELVREWRAAILREDKRFGGLMQLRRKHPPKRFNPLAEEEKIKEDWSNPD